MSVNSKSYPHPVLGNADDAKGSFAIDFKYELGREAVVLDIKFNLQNGNIEKLVGQKKADFVVETECRSTFFRKSFSTINRNERFSIPARLLRERVRVSFYICASEDMKNYSPSDAHADYQNIKFDIEKGDVVAIGGSCSFIAEKSFDPLRPPVSSLMSIREGRSHGGPMEIDYHTDKIIIELSKEDWKNYLEVKKQGIAIGTLHASIVFPVLVDAVFQVRIGSNEYEDSAWFGRLEAILDAKGLREKEPFEGAQRILDNPVARNFQSVNSMLDVDLDKEYE
ncbi:MAG: hypothetical protein WC845_03865 [Candidatus Staskawiczbacteria bacterium]|jgi:hypothetical protein